MKKLMLLIAATCFVFVSCNNKPAEEQVATEEETEVADEEHHCCQMTEEQKAFKADWENWENLTEERKAELVAQAKECFDKRMAEMDLSKIECEKKRAEMETKKAEIDQVMANWDNMTVEEQKAFFDDNAPCCHKHECHKGEGEGCCKGGEKKPCHHENE